MALCSSVLPESGAVVGKEVPGEGAAAERPAVSSKSHAHGASGSVRVLADAVLQTQTETISAIGGGAGRRGMHYVVQKSTHLVDFCCHLRHLNTTICI